MTTLNFNELWAALMSRHLEWPNAHKADLAFRAVELAGEAGEACNVIKKLLRERMGAPGSRATLDDLADELADVVICAGLVAMQENINLGEAVVRKFNATSDKIGLRTKL